MLTREEQDFLDRLNAPTDQQAYEIDSERKGRRELFLRNILNSIFMLMAVIAMAGIGYAMYKESQQIYTISIGIGLAAVLIKMVEATLRMSNMLQKPRHEQSKRKRARQK